MYGTEENLIKFWAGLERTDGEFCRNHPVVQKTPPNRRIPIGLHGDDAGIAGRHCVLGINWGSVAQSLATMDSRIAFTGIRTEDCVQDDTVIEIYKVLKWSLNVMAEGKWPSHDHNNVPLTTKWRIRKAGTDLAGGFVGAWTELRGDWKYLVETLLLKEHYGETDHICHLCNVRKIAGPFPYTDFCRTSAQ